ncbi:leucine zipper domain-containing protein [Paraburkholderia phytofirmans]|uniref:leucine zipper domain-containing protein n=1 Tax=Paraburkholderia TaxID=1822464 RepID=UPI001F2B2B01|nr:leucine zipper domain-containing protein [Paraburkholderia phytofirmans]
MCRRFNISYQTNYQWLDRHKTEDADGLANRSRRPHHSPTRSSDRITERDCAQRQHWQRFEHEQPNSLWQMDFQDDFPTGGGVRCSLEASHAYCATASPGIGTGSG